MTGIVSRSQIEGVLRRWQLGEIGHLQVFDWANRRYCTSQWAAEDEVANEVLSELDRLDMNLITREDIPHLLAILSVRAGELEAAVSRLAEYSKNIDLEARREVLKNDSFYGPFCK